MMYSNKMDHKFKIEGIYDQRTLKLLKSRQVRDFGFNFSPKSFNFIQEHVFLNELIPLIEPLDKIYLRFARSNDPMIKKVIEDLKKAGVQDTNLFLECDEWSTSPNEFEIKYFLNYYPEQVIRPSIVSSLHLSPYRKSTIPRSKGKAMGSN